MKWDSFCYVEDVTHTLSNSRIFHVPRDLLRGLEIRPVSLRPEHLIKAKGLEKLDLRDREGKNEKEKKMRDNERARCRKRMGLHSIHVILGIKFN